MEANRATWGQRRAHSQKDSSRTDVHCRGELRNGLVLVFEAANKNRNTEWKALPLPPIIHTKGLRPLG
jgi:hypothetical protein